MEEDEKSRIKNILIGVSYIKPWNVSTVHESLFNKKFIYFKSEILI